MGAFGVLLGSLHFLGLYIQFSASTRHGGHADLENHVSGNAMFMEVPHDMKAQRGQDVEMACSFRGAGTPSYSLEIQWWYIKNHRDWTDNQPWITNQVIQQEEVQKEATKISVVKVVGSNVSHKLRLSAVKPSDQGTYECRVIDFSDSTVRHHHVKAYLQVAPESNHDEEQAAQHHGSNLQLQDDTTKTTAFNGARINSHTSSRPQQSPGYQHEPVEHLAAHQGHSLNHHKAEGKELKKRSAGSSNRPNDCSDNCVL